MDRSFNVALNAASRLNLVEEIFDFAKIFNIGELHDPNRFVDPRISDYDSGGHGERGTVVFPLFPSVVLPQSVLGILSHAFRIRGFDVVQVRCDESIPICNLDTVLKSESLARSVCRYHTDRTATAFGFEPGSVDDMLAPGYTPDASQVTDGIYSDVDIGRLARGAARRYFFKYHIDLDDPTEHRVYRQFLRTGVKLVDAYESILEENDVVAVVAFNDHYVHGGTPLAVAANRDVPAYSVEFGYRDRALVFGRWKNRSSLPMFTDAPTVEEILDRPLTPEQAQQVSSLFEERMSGEGTRYRYSPQTDVSVESSGEELLVGMFTNLTWDASLEIEDAVFPDMFDWIHTTISSFGDRNNVRLVVRTHPAECVRRTRELVTEWIEQNIEDLPSNVTVIPPCSDLNTYKLISDLDAGIVYSSFVGLEMVYQGVPTVVAGDTHYRDLGISTDPGTKAEYLDIINDVENMRLEERNIERAQRYAYFFFFQKHVDFPFIEGGTQDDDPDLTYISHDAITPGNEAVDRIVQSVLEDGVVLQR